ncbi:hypothetical protein K490DRAFT_70003 [Saccharata proteae CBS 121410]|uniref:Uncharacterized protein n=1 Tax=Saccharata proteae CBS 121410 TaxID=1314787 RepID=A0A9P4LTQ4_9PEZI|nr:hypothetical protein K490DRAFT_70003 [Saccharata proteae CBS 121410]
MYFAPPSNHTYKLCDTNSFPEKTDCPFGPTTGVYLYDGNCHYDTDYVHSVATTGPSTILSNVQVLYSSNVYLSFKTAYAEDQCSSRVGKGYAGAVVTLASTDLYSANGPDLGGAIPYSVTGGYSFNFDDLMSVPGQIYMGASCQNGPSSWGYGPANGIKHTSWWCDTIYQSAYFPTLLVPPQIRSLDPAWASCQLDLCGSLDPPIVLTAETLMAKPTSSFAQDPKKSEAAPASSAVPHIAKSTVTSADPITATGAPSKASGRETVAFTVFTPKQSSQASQDPNVITLKFSKGPAGPDWNALPPEAISLIATGGVAVMPFSQSTSAAKDSETVGASQDPDPLIQSGVNLGSSPAISTTDPAGVEMGGAAPVVSEAAASTGVPQADPDPEPASNPGAQAQDPEITGASPPEGSSAMGSVGDITAVNNPGHTGGVIIDSNTVPPNAATGVPDIPMSVGSGFVVADSQTWTLPQPGTIGNTPVATIGSQPVYADSADPGTVYIGSSKVPLAAGSVTTIDNTPVSMDQGNIVIGSTTMSLPSANNQVIATVGGSEVLVTPVVNGGAVIGGATFSAGGVTTIAGAKNIPVGNSDPKVIATIGAVEITPDPANTEAVVIDGNTFSAGDVTTVAGMPISVGPGGVVAGSQTIPFGNSIAKAIATIGAVEITPDPIKTGAVVIDGNTFSAGGVTTISGTPISVGAGNVIFGSKTVPIGNGNSKAIATIGTVEITPDPMNTGAIVIEGSTLSAGVLTTIAGTPVSVGSGYAVVGSKTVSLPGANSDVIATIGGMQITTDPSDPGAVMIGGTPISVGAVTTVAGTPVSIGSGYAVIGSKTILLPSADSPVLATIGNMEITTDPSNPNAVMIGGNPVSKGVVTTISGTPVSVGSGVVVAGSRTIPLPNITPGPLAILSNLKFSTDPSKSNAILIGSTTLSQGDVATISGTIVSVGSGVFAVGSQTFMMPSFTSEPTLDATFTDNGSVYTASSIDGTIYLGSQTLSKGGPAATLPGGEVITAGTNGLVVGTATFAFTTAPTLAAVFTDNGNVYTASRIDGTVYLGSLTLSEGGPAATLSGGEVVTAGADGLVVGTSTIDFATVTGTDLISQKTSASVSRDMIASSHDWKLVGAL